MTPHIREIQHPDGTRRRAPFPTFEAAKQAAISSCLSAAGMQSLRGYETSADDLLALVKVIHPETQAFTLRAAAYTFRVYPGSIDPVTYEVIA